MDKEVKQERDTETWTEDVENTTVENEEVQEEITEETIKDVEVEEVEVEEPLTKQVKELKEGNLRIMAEFDNFRRRTAKEKLAQYDRGAKETLEKLLPIIDNFERAMENVSKEDENCVSQGVSMIYKQLMTTINDLGVKEIEAEGVEFNQDLHHAVSHVENEELGENIVAQVFQKGYMYKEEVLRYAMVVVAN